MGKKRRIKKALKTAGRLKIINKKIDAKKDRFWNQAQINLQKLEEVSYP
jgi:hypothetical protein